MWRVHRRDASDPVSKHPITLSAKMISLTFSSLSPFECLTPYSLSSACCVGVPACPSFTPTMYAATVSASSRESGDDRRMASSENSDWSSVCRIAGVSARNMP